MPVTPEYGINYTFESYAQNHMHFSGLNVSCPICHAAIGAQCQDRNKRHEITEMHRARRSRSKKMVRIIEKEQLAQFDAMSGRASERLFAPNRGGSAWSQAFSQKWLSALQSMHEAQMLYFKRKLRGEEPFNAISFGTSTGRVSSTLQQYQQQFSRAIRGKEASSIIVDEASSWKEIADSIDKKLFESLSRYTK